MSTQKKVTKKKSLKKEKIQDKMYEILPLLFIAAIVPLVLYIKKVTLTDAGNMYWDGRDTYLDVFTYYKMVLLLLFSAAGLLIFSFSRKSIPLDTQRKTYYIPMGVYLLFVILSALLSEYKQVAFFGYRDRYEGALVLMAYVVILFMAANVLNEEKSIKIFFLCLLGSSFVISILGALQLFELDYFKSGFFNSLITPLSLKAENVTVNSNFPPKTVFSTLYNPNYVGSYMAMLIPVILIFLVWVKKNTHRLILAVLLSLAAINAAGSESSAGMVGIAVSIIVILIMFRKKILQHKKITIAVVILLCGGLAAINFATNGKVLNKIMQTVFSGGNGAVSDSKKALEQSLQGLKDVSMDSERAKIVTDKGTLQIMLTAGRLSLTDENDKELASSLENNIVSFADERFQHIKLSTKPEKGLIEVNYNDYRLIDIVLTKEGLNSISNRWMLDRGDKSIETFGFEGKESLGTNRGYIWSRALPLLKDSILVGFGPDTFPMHFPQYDYVGKLKLYENGGIYVDKPHNMYLQTAANTGVISLLALLAVFGLYFVSSIKIYIKEEFDTFLPIAGLACFAAFCAYAATGLFNDSVVSVAPVFWMLLGLGIGINMKLMKGKMAGNEVKLNTVKMVKS